MNTVNLGAGNILIPFNNSIIEIDGIMYKDLVVIARLLNSEEITRVLRISVKDAYGADEMFEDIFRSCIVSIPGIKDGSDLEKSSAGFIATVGSAILTKSMSHIDDPIKTFKEYTENVDILDTMSAIVSKYLSTPYLEVKKLPINKLFEMYAVCHKAFPNEVTEIKEQEDTINKDVGVNTDD